jgi:hypothetical protein
MIIFIYPIFSICHSNEYIYELTNCFKQSSKDDDYQLIGGSDYWISFMTNCPCSWTLFGVWITWDRLFAATWTIIVAAIASGAAAFFSQIF